MPSSERVQVAERRRAASNRPGWVKVERWKWRHDSRWEVRHCGHPTALWPYYGQHPDGRPILIPNGYADTAGGYAFQYLADAQEAVEREVAAGSPYPKGGTQGREAGARRRSGAVELAAAPMHADETSTAMRRRSMSSGKKNNPLKGAQLASLVELLPECGHGMVSTARRYRHSYLALEERGLVGVNDPEDSPGGYDDPEDAKERRFYVGLLEAGVQALRDNRHRLSEAEQRLLDRHDRSCPRCETRAGKTVSGQPERAAEVLQTRGALAASRKSKAAELSHTVVLDASGEERRVLCNRIELDNLADRFAGDINEKPTCKVCLARDSRFKGEAAAHPLGQAKLPDALLAAVLPVWRASLPAKLRGRSIDEFLALHQPRLLADLAKALTNHCG